MELNGATTFSDIKLPTWTEGKVIFLERDRVPLETQNRDSMHKFCYFCNNLYSAIYFWNVHLLTLFQYSETGL